MGMGGVRGLLRGLGTHRKHGLSPRAFEHERPHEHGHHGLSLTHTHSRSSELLHATDGRPGAGSPGAGDGASQRHDRLHDGKDVDAGAVPGIVVTSVAGEAGEAEVEDGWARFASRNWSTSSGDATDVSSAECCGRSGDSVRASERQANKIGYWVYESCTFFMLRYRFMLTIERRQSSVVSVSPAKLSGNILLPMNRRKLVRSRLLVSETTLPFTSSLALLTLVTLC